MKQWKKVMKRKLIYIDGKRLKIKILVKAKNQKFLTVKKQSR